LFFCFMPISCLCSSIIIFMKESCLLSFCMWTRVRVTYLSNLFLILFIYVACDPFLLFFFHVSSLCW
jgi:hypothetical protein